MERHVNADERVFPWTQDTIRWYRDAETFVGNDRSRVLSGLILRELPEMPSLIDMGCGLGYLGMELSAGASSVLSVDLNESALDFLMGEINQRGISNMEVRKGDFELMDIESGYDAMVLCMFGGSQDCLSIAENWVDKIFMVANAASKRSLSVKDEPSKNKFAEEIIEYLDGGGYKYKHTHVSAQFGQPLVSREDAYRFVANYNASADAKEIEDMLSRRLIETGRNDFPFYIPSEKNYSFFVIEKR